MNGSGSAVLPILAAVGVGVATVYTGGGALAAVAAGAAAGGATYAGQQQQQAIAAQEQQVKAQAEAEKVDAKARANEIRRQMLATLGAQNAALASRGLALGSGGTPADLAAAARGNYEQDLRFSRLNSLMRHEATQFQLGQLGLASRANVATTITNVGSSAANAYITARRIGETPTSGSGSSTTAGRPRPLFTWNGGG